MVPPPAELQAFPALTPLEFSNACKALEARSADSLHGTDWMSVRCTGVELLISQRRHAKFRDRGNEEEGLEGKEVDGDMKVIEEEDDGEILMAAVGGVDESEHNEREALLVDFSIVLSPTYSVPVLWFSCRRNSDGKPLSLDEVYDFLVPQSTLESLRSIGVMGGISMAHHPVSDLPSFFLHPCNTQEALLAVKPEGLLTPELHLLLWLGLMGSAVGLHVPSKLLSA